MKTIFFKTKNGVWPIFKKRLFLHLFLLNLLIFNQLNAQTIAINTGPTVCQSASFNYTINEYYGPTYYTRVSTSNPITQTWSVTGGGTISPNAQAASISVNWATTGNYNVSLTVNCTFLQFNTSTNAYIGTTTVTLNDSKSVTVSAPPSAPTIISPSSPQINSAVFSVQNPQNGTLEYRWYTSLGEAYNPNTTHKGNSRTANLSATGTCNTTTFYVAAAYLGQNCESSRTATTAVQVCPETQIMYSNKATIYGYGHTLPIAEVAYARLNQVAYTGFESTSVNETATWAYTQGSVQGSVTDVGHTGNRYYVLNVATNPISKNTIPSGKYILSYWANGQVNVNCTNCTAAGALIELNVINGWHYYERVISPSNTSNMTISLVAGTGVTNRKIDDVRLHPVEARMVTYTYDPLVGLTSKTDANSQTEYYEYDSFGRQEFVKDEKGNIIKQTFQYIKGQN
jgi:hypothetical protein